MKRVVEVINNANGEFVLMQNVIDSKTAFPKIMIEDLQAFIDHCNIQCKRRSIELHTDGHIHSVCWGYGNAYGHGVGCKEDCVLRITDLEKCRIYRNTKNDYSFVAQPEFYRKSHDFHEHEEMASTLEDILNGNDVP